MSNPRITLLSFAALSLALVAFAPNCVAQCSPNSSIDGIAPQPGNPFQAEKVTTLTPEPQNNFKLAPKTTLPTLVARDSQGRVRIEFSGGTFKVMEGEGAGSEAVQRTIRICDPVGKKTIMLDTLNKTATVHSQLRATPHPGIVPQVSRPLAYCKTFASLQSAGNLQREDLGHQMIDGVDAQGVRTTRPFPAMGNSEANNSTLVTEDWCADELGVMILRIQQTGQIGQKRETKLANIVLGEPDATLFQIPPDYRVVEAVHEQRDPIQPSFNGISSTIVQPFSVEPRPQ